MKAVNDFKLGNWTAIISFLIGTGIFVLYFLTSAWGLCVAALYYILFAASINIIVLVIVIVNSIAKKANKIKLLKTCGIMLLNIPIVLFYFWIGSFLNSIKRVTFINSTKSEMSEIKIVGCDKSEYIYRLEPGEGKTIWINTYATPYCLINIEYLSNGMRKEDRVGGYISNNPVQKVTYNIGGKND